MNLGVQRTIFRTNQCIITKNLGGGNKASALEKEVPEDILFTEALPDTEEEEIIPTKKRKRSKKSSVSRKGAKRSKKGKKRSREVLFRTKVRKTLLRKYWALIAKRKRINKAIRDNRRHRNQLVFHRT